MLRENAANAFHLDGLDLETDDDAVTTNATDVDVDVGKRFVSVFGFA